MSNWAANGAMAGGLEPGWCQPGDFRALRDLLLRLGGSHRFLRSLPARKDVDKPKSICHTPQVTGNEEAS